MTINTWLNSPLSTLDHTLKISPAAQFSPSQLLPLFRQDLNSGTLHVPDVHEGKLVSQPIVRSRDIDPNDENIRRAQTLGDEFIYSVEVLRKIVGTDEHGCLRQPVFSPWRISYSSQANDVEDNEIEVRHRSAETRTTVTFEDGAKTVTLAFRTSLVSPFSFSGPLYMAVGEALPNGGTLEQTAEVGSGIDHVTKSTYVTKTTLTAGYFIRGRDDFIAALAQRLRTDPKGVALLLALLNAVVKSGQFERREQYGAFASDVNLRQLADGSFEWPKHWRDEEITIHLRSLFANRHLATFRHASSRDFQNRLSVILTRSPEALYQGFPLNEAVYALLSGK